MKNTLSFSAAVLTLLASLGSGAALFPNHAFAQQGQMMCPCPYDQGMMMRPGMMGPGMGGGQGMMMGPGMMGPGMGGQGMMYPYQGGQGMMMGPGMMGPGMGGQGMPYGRMTQPQNLTVDDVRTMLERQLAWQGNPRLKVGAVKEKDKDILTAEIVTADGSLVQRLEVDRHTGWMKQVP